MARSYEATFNPWCPLLMSTEPFVHLRVHSAYSLAEGAIHLKALAKHCAAESMPAVAVTDTDNLFGALEFSLAAAEQGVQPIIGTLLAIKHDNNDPGRRDPGGTERIVLLVKDAQGYQNLMRLVSRAYLETQAGERPFLPLAALDGSTEGLICLTGGPGGPVGAALRRSNRDLAENLLRHLSTLFPGRLYVEIMRHGVDHEERIENDLIALAYAHDVPLVATNDCHFMDRAMYDAHDALLCVADGTYVIEDDRRRLTPEFGFKSAEEMRTLFADLPEAIDNTAVIARRCSFLLGKVSPILPPFDTEGGRSEVEELRAQAEQGLANRLDAHVYSAAMSAGEREEAAKPYRDRLDMELGIIEQMGFPGYFLIVSDFIKWAKDHEIPVGPGRGSGAGSVVAWSLLITDLDPLRFNLLFERFLNPERVSMPDFDVDFCQDRRDEVIRYVQDKYGHDHVAQIITFGKLQARAVVRDVGRVLQMPYGQVDRISKLVPFNPAKPVTLQQAIDGEPILQQMQQSDEQVARLIKFALRLEGLYRHASTHAAGVVIGDRPLQELVPLYRDPRSDMPVTQFNMKYVEQAGLVKFDFLGLKTLTVLKTAVDHIRDTGVDIELSALPLDDDASYSMLARAETTGVFQLESSGMRDVLRRAKPQRFEDIIALVALYRPGPMDNIPRYVAVKNGDEAPDYMHPKLEPILKETFGIMIYQEQVMQAAQLLAGYSLGGADLLRRAMGKKIQAEMDAQRERFSEGAVERGISEQLASDIFDQIAKFAGYGFNKSHAAAYALVAYQTAYLKANYPVQFLAASMTLDLGNTDKLNVFRQELDRLQIPLLQPDLNKSDAVFAVDRSGQAPGIRYALAAIKGVGQQAMEAIVEERRVNGPFDDVFDFARRTDPHVVNKRQLENLVCAGAFDSLEPNRRKMFDGIEMLLKVAHAEVNDRQSGMSSLFATEIDRNVPKLRDVEDWEPMDRLRHEFEAIGFYLSAHPLDAFTRPLERMRAIRYADIGARLQSGGSSRVTLAGIVLSKSEKVSQKSGNRYAFVQLSDTSGSYEAMVFSEVLSMHREDLAVGSSVVIEADIQTNDDGYRVTVQKIENLEAAAQRTAAGLLVFLETADATQSLKATLDLQGRGRGKVTVVVPLDPAREAEIDLPGAWAIDTNVRRAIKAIEGVMDVREL